MGPSDPSRYGNNPIPTSNEAEQHSAGGVLYKRESGKYKVCLVAKRQGRVWALPKGRLDPGETVDQTAKREILEETGHKAEIIDVLDEITYYFFLKESQTLYHKKVTFFLMKLVQENFQERDQENDMVSWVDVGEAAKRLSYINEKKVLKKAQGLMH